MSSLVNLQEEFVIKQILKMEKDLMKHVDKPYRETGKVIIDKIKKVYAKYDNYPDTFKYQLIQKDLSKERVFHQISRRYVGIGKGFSDFLRGSLQDSFKQSVVQANMTVKSAKQAAKGFEATYQETNDIEADWRKRTLNHSRKVNKLITQGIANHNSIDQLTDKLVAETGMQVYEAKRLARTEQMRVINHASLITFQGMGIKKVKWLDSTEQVGLKNKRGNKKKSNVCDNCRGFASGGTLGKGIYYITMLPHRIPAHPNCRCTLAPVIDK